MYDDYDDEDDSPKVDITKLRYVLYARKSTDDPKRQVRSIPDQIDECRRLAKELGIKVVAVIEEKGSAKIPNKRPEFDKMMKAMGKQYDAMLSWHPDRLSRNMQEGSAILELVDTKVVKDLKFVTHYFTNNASGKMLLGISFVMADYYVKNLSENIGRGVKKGLKEGKSSGTPMHGYIRGEDNKYHPDNENGSKNFDLICQAWKMRKEGKSLEVIAKHMTDGGYARAYKDKAAKAGEKVLMTDKILSDRVFPSPFYYGVLIQTGKPIDLRELPGYGFVPATDEQTYNDIQAMTGRRSTDYKKRAIFKPLVGMVFCAYCRKKMYPQTPLSGAKTEKKRILSYRCDTTYCPRHKKDLNLPKSIRAMVVFGFMSDMLKNLNVTELEYGKLKTKLVATNAAKIQKTAIKLHSKQAALKSMQQDIKERSLKILNIIDQTTTIYKNNEAHINELEMQRQELADEISALQQQKTSPDEDMLSFNEFLNVAKNAHLLLEAADIGIKDRIARLIYLNVTVDDQNVVEYQIREPFRTYFQMHKILDGRGDRTRTCDLTAPSRTR
jgi:DNA invertase Pin-like site-specific DNA recombinase